MKKILILGALLEESKLYEAMVEVCQNYADEVSSPIDTAKFQGTDTERYERAFKKVKEADFIIGEQSKPSTGQGMEIREAAVLNKPLLVVAKEGSKVSGLVKGCPVLKDIIYYKDLDDLKDKLKDFLEHRNS